MERENRKVTPRSRQAPEENPNVPLHPDDIPYDPDLDADWRRKQGRPELPSNKKPRVDLDNDDEGGEVSDHIVPGSAPHIGTEGVDFYIMKPKK